MKCIRIYTESSCFQRWHSRFFSRHGTTSLNLLEIVDTVEMQVKYVHVVVLNSTRL